MYHRLIQCHYESWPSAFSLGITHEINNETFYIVREEFALPSLCSH